MRKLAKSRIYHSRAKLIVSRLLPPLLWFTSNRWETHTSANSYIFCCWLFVIQGAQYSMQKILPSIHIVNGMQFGNGPAILPYLQRQAQRSGFPVQVSWLVRLQMARRQVPADDRASKKWTQPCVYRSGAEEVFPELKYSFRRIGIDIAAATDLVKDLDSRNMRPTATGDVQKGLLE